MPSGPLGRSPSSYRALSLVTAVLAAACHTDSTTGPARDRISAVVVTALRQVLAPGDTLRVTAQVLDSLGRVLPAEPVTWSSSTPAVARIDAGGLVTADSVGATTLVATAGGKEPEKLADALDAARKAIRTQLERRSPSPVKPT